MQYMLKLNTFHLKSHLNNKSGSLTTRGNDWGNTERIQYIKNTFGPTLQKTKQFEKIKKAPNP